MVSITGRRTSISMRRFPGALHARQVAQSTLPARARLTADEDVLGDGESGRPGADGHGDPGAARRRARGATPRRRPDDAALSSQDAGQDLDQRALSGAAAGGERMYCPDRG
jgi:hypothetical protein